MLLYILPIVSSGLFVFVWIYFIRLQKFKQYRLKQKDKVLMSFTAILFVLSLIASFYAL